MQGPLWCLLLLLVHRGSLSSACSFTSSCPASLSSTTCRYRIVTVHCLEADCITQGALRAVYNHRSPSNSLATLYQPRWQAATVGQTKLGGGTRVTLFARGQASAAATGGMSQSCERCTKSKRLHVCLQDAAAQRLIWCPARQHFVAQRAASNVIIAERWELAVTLCSGCSDMSDNKLYGTLHSSLGQLQSLGVLYANPSICLA